MNDSLDFDDEGSADGFAPPESIVPRLDLYSPDSIMECAEDSDMSRSDNSSRITLMSIDSLEIGKEVVIHLSEK